MSDNPNNPDRPQQDLPENALRGLRKSNWRGPNGAVLSTAFDPDSRTAAKREDSGEETSINFEDDDGALPALMANREQSANGAARFPIATVAYINQQPGSADGLSLERDELDDNRYHGNIVFRAGLSKQTKRMIAGTLALASVAIDRS